MAEDRLAWGIVHFTVCAVPAWFAFIFTMPPSTFASNPTAFRVMAEIMTEPQWAMVSGFVAAVGFVSWHLNNIHAWRFASLLLSSWHSLVALCLLQANPQSTGTGTYLIIAIAATAKMLRRFR